MVVAQLLGTNDAMQIRLHQLLDQENLAKFFQRGGLENIEDCNDVFVSEMTEKLNLAKRSEAEHGVVEGRNALNSDFALRRNVDC